MNEGKIKGLFASRIDRRIEEVIKVDQEDEGILIDEIEEYVATDSIRQFYSTILDRYYETPNKPHEGIAVWISGFFGSGKSSFAKMLGLALQNRELKSKSSTERFGRRVGDSKIQVLLTNICEHIPTETVVFDLSTDRGIRSANQMLTEIMYREFLGHMGYARDMDLAELEITLDGEGRLDVFKTTYQQVFDKDWDQEKGKVAIALSQASRVMHEVDAETYPAADSWVKAAKSRADISPNMLAQRCQDLMSRHCPDRSLLFVIDEVGQFVARDVQKMLDLQGIVQALGRVGRGKIWVVVTSQERLSELVGGLDDKRVELARLMDRFPQELQVHLEPSDISEVTSKRVLVKNANAEKVLRELFEQHRGRLINNTRLSADIRLPEIDAESFVSLYPLLPYHIDLIIQVVSGLRTHGGVSRHVGGANRTIIKLAQQLLINPAVALGEANIGKLATIAHVYDLVKGNIDSEIRDKIDRIPSEVGHPLAQSVCKAICLLQYVQSIHRTAENISATLHSSVSADSLLSGVNEALAELEKSHKVRKGDDGYRIPTPAEDDWENRRAGLEPKPADVNRIQGQILENLWQPQPSHNFMNTKMFKAGLHLNGRPRAKGDILFNVHLAEAGKEFDECVAEVRGRSQVEDKSVFWVVSLDSRIDRQTTEVFRSEEMLSRKERSAQTKAELALVSEEKRKLANTHKPELKRLLHSATLNGTVFFRGNDRSPGDSATDLNKTVSELLGVALPEVYDRFSEAAAHVQKKDIDSLITSENLRGLTPIFSTLNLITDERGKPVFSTDSGALAEVLSKIENQYTYGLNPTGRYLSDEFGKEPFGWDFDIVRLFVLCLLRGGKINLISKGQTIESVSSIEAKNVFSNNNLFRQASFRPKETSIDFEKLVQVSEAFQKTFGKSIEELEQGVVAKSIRTAVSEHEEKVRDVENTLRNNTLPGVDILTDVISQMKAIRTANEENSILTFSGCHAELKEAISRSMELEKTLTETALFSLGQARKALSDYWPFLRDEDDIDEKLTEKAQALEDILLRETFFKELPSIDQYTQAVVEAYTNRFEEAVTRRAKVYSESLDKLRATSGWEQIQQDQQERISEPLASRATQDVSQATPIPQLRSDIDACSKRLDDAIAQVLKIVEGNRLIQVNANSYFRDGIETEGQLDTALGGLRDECTKHIAAGKKVFLK